MKSRALYASLLLAACGVAHPLQGKPGRPPTLPAAADRRIAVTEKDRPPWARAVAKLTWRTKKSGAGVGTAVLVAPRLAMTTWHCARDWAGPATLRFGFDGLRRTQLATRSAKKVVASSMTGDWAILELDRPLVTIPPLKMARKPIRKCDTKRMLLAGYSCDAGRGRRGLLLTYDIGCRLRKVRTEAGRLLTNAICFEGASGGPAFVKDKGTAAYHWFGIVQGNINRHDPRNFVTYAVYQPSYEGALRRALKQYR